MVSNEQYDEPVHVPVEVTQGRLDLSIEQDNDRGDWPNPRLAQSPEPPWAPLGDRALRHLVAEYDARIDAGYPVRDAALRLAFEAYHEGGIANYDRGQRDARAALSDGT